MVAQKFNVGAQNRTKRLLSPSHCSRREDVWNTSYGHDNIFHLRRNIKSIGFGSDIWVNRDTLRGISRRRRLYYHSLV